MKLSISELKRHSRQMLDKHYNVPVYGLLITTLITALLLLPFQFLLGNSATLMQQIIYYLAEFIICVLASLLQCGLYYVHLKLEAEKEVSFKDLLFAFRNRTDRFISASVCYLLINFVCYLPCSICQTYISQTQETTSLQLLYCILMLAGTVVFLFFSLSFAFLYLLLVEKTDLTVREAFSSSYRLMKGFKRKLFVLYLSFIGWALLGILSFFIGFLWISPYMTQTLISFYKQVSASAAKAA